MMYKEFTLNNGEAQQFSPFIHFNLPECTLTKRDQAVQLD